MKLARVTITGADDGVKWEDLIDLSRQYPFVEWGILLSMKRQATVRYPGREWRRLFAKARAEAQVKVSTSLHLCGDVCREVLAGDTAWPDPWDYDRVQLNGFSKYRLPLLRFARAHEDREIILQVQNLEALRHAEELATFHPNVSVLWDESGGSGSVIRKFYVLRGVRMGYAGGLDPENLLDRLHHLSENTEAVWIDMESGVRTDDRFDLEKVRRILELAAPFVGGANA